MLHMIMYHNNRFINRIKDKCYVQFLNAQFQHNRRSGNHVRISGIWNGTHYSLRLMSRILRLQNRAVHMTCSLHKYDHVSHHTVNVKMALHLFIYKMSLYVYNSRKRSCFRTSKSTT